MTDLAVVIIYSVVSVVFALANVVLAIVAFRRKGNLGFYFGITCMFAALVECFYLSSALTGSYFFFSVMTGLYFASIDAVLLALFCFCAHLADYANSNPIPAIRKILFGYGIFDILVQLINPFWEISISYEAAGLTLPSFSYVMKPLYYMHLVYSYVIIAVVFLLLFRKLRSVPKEYRNQYLCCILSLGIIVAINALFLYVPLPIAINRLDISILGYTVGLYFLYFSSLSYSTRSLMDLFRSNILENIMQGIVLFDYNDSLIMNNSRAASLLPPECLQPGISFREFLPACGIEQDLPDTQSDISIQCYMHSGNLTLPVRCDHRILKNERNLSIGRLLVFTNSALTSDLLTGFHSWDHFQQSASGFAESYGEPAIVMILDINGLTLLNKEHGRSFGDQAIQELASLMRKTFPKQTFFVRGPDANLIALLKSIPMEQVNQAIKNVENAFSHNIVYSIFEIGDRDIDVLGAIEEAFIGLRTKKLLDRESLRSQLLTSLMRALEECDPDTEAHVKRTQQLGAMLGQRINLSDMEQSQLSLLCMLHDIGKIGIPLDVLNKPGKLTDQEWKTIQTHVEKGYQIALSVEELSGIADVILHHHERWDGRGYPTGLKGTDIPLLARIIAVVDAYDAMTNDRSYRKALPISEAIAELKRFSGLQFDPELVKEFLQVIPVVDQDAYRSQAAATSSAEITPQSMRTAVAESELLVNTVHPLQHCRYTLDENMRIVAIGDGFEQLTGYTAEDIRTRNMYQIDMIPPGDRQEYQVRVANALRNSPSAFLEHRLLCKDGRSIYVFCYGKAYYNSISRTTYTEIVISNVSDTYSVRTLTNDAAEVKRLPERNEANTLRDPLTSLLKYDAFRSDTEAAIGTGKYRVLILKIDVDSFTDYNAAHGSNVGDACLISIARTLAGALRREDLACRVGEDEFAAAVLFDSNSDNKPIYKRTQQIFDKISMTLAAKQNQITVSMGAAVSNEACGDFEALYHNAGMALRSSKQAGSSRVTIFES